MKTTCYYELLQLKIGITEEDGAITGLFFAAKDDDAGAKQAETPLLRAAALQLEQYLSGRRREFFLPLEPQGTPFQKTVWQALETIPYGQTRSYKQIAEQIGHARAFRAVGLANNRNPIAIIIPCHRVIGNNGSLVGYGGGLDVKKSLLQMEQSAAR